MHSKAQLARPSGTGVELPYRHSLTNILFSVPDGTPLLNHQFTGT